MSNMVHTSFETLLAQFFKEDGNGQINLLNSVSNCQEFVRELTERILKEPSTHLLQLLTTALTLHSNQALRTGLTEYFGLPLLKQLSESRFNYEASVNQNLAEITFLDGSSEEFVQKSTFFPALIKSILPKSELHPLFLNLLIVVLLQPSIRRFVKPFLEDSLVLQQFNFSSVPDVERLIHYPINENTGVYFETPEEHFQAKFHFVQEFHSELLKSGKCTQLAKLSTIELTKCPPLLADLSLEELKFVLNLLHCGNVPNEISKEALIQEISALLQCPSIEQPSAVFNPFSTIPVLPLTTESLSLHDLLDRHYRLFQARCSTNLQEKVLENIILCKPVLNRLGKTEFGGWSRNACEALAAAVIRRRSTALSANYSCDHVEMEVSISSLPFDDLTTSSWTSLQLGDSVVVGNVVAYDAGFKINYIRQTWFQHLKHSKNLLTLTLKAESLSNENITALNTVNFIMKIQDPDATELQLLNAVHQTLNSKGHVRLPDIIGDYLLGIEDEVDFSLHETDKNVGLPEMFNDFQRQACTNVCKSKLSITYGPFTSGVTSVLVHAVSTLAAEGEKTIVIAHNEAALGQLYSQIVASGVKPKHIVQLDYKSNWSAFSSTYTAMVKAAIDDINKIICNPLGLSDVDSCHDCEYIWNVFIVPRWNAFKVLLNSGSDIQLLQESYPFNACTKLQKESFEGHFASISELFESVRELAPLELLHGSDSIANFVLSKLSRVILMTSAFAASNRPLLVKMNLKFDNLFVDDAHFISEAESLLHLTLQKDTFNLKRLAFFGHPVLSSNLTLFQRLLSYGFTNTNVSTSSVLQKSPCSHLLTASSELQNCCHFVHVAPVLGPGEEELMKNYYQNLDEAEYAVALYQILRANGVPAEDCAIIASNRGQVDLIHEIIAKRCDWTTFYGKPKFVGTIMASSGIHAKVVIISLVRTKLIGELHDSSLLDIAISRASETVYLLGNFDLFSEKFPTYFAPIASHYRKLILPDGKSFDNVEDVCGFAYELSQKLPN